MKVLIWAGLVLLYLFVCGFLSNAIGVSALYSVITVAIGYGFYRVGRAITRNH